MFGSDSFLCCYTKRDTAEGQALIQFLGVNILTDRGGWGVPVVLSDLTEPTIFQRGNEGPNQMFHVQFQNFSEVSSAIVLCLEPSLSAIETLC